jgi:peptidoglycan/LPS O-acetylase OafA/YrhL
VTLATVLRAPDDEDAPATSHFRSDIQGLRAVAVTLVILAHAGVPGLAGGFLGVDVFFVISGYVITGVLLREVGRGVGRGLVHFYSRRVRRIVPAATLALVATVVVSHLVLGSRLDRSLYADVRWASLFAANWRLIHVNASYFVPGVAPSLVTHFWSLGVEEQFYLAFPLVVLGVGALTSESSRRFALGVVLGIGITASALYASHISAGSPVLAYYSPFSRYFELALGGLCALVPRWALVRTPRLNTLAAVVAAAALAAAVWRIGPTSTYPGTLAWWPCAATGALLLTGTASLRGGVAWWLGRRPLRYLGDISYGLYLWHYGWLLLPALLAHPLVTPRDRVLEVAGALVCAVLSYHLLENPIRRSRRLEADPAAVALMLGVCLLLTWDVTIVTSHLH